jgi:hypothetical protein
MKLCALVLALSFLAPSAFAQSPWKAPRTEHGAPDLQGVWSTLTATPLERPSTFDSLTTTEERAAAYARSAPDAFTSDTSDGVGARQSEWWEFSPHMTRIDGEVRTSLIVDPPSGKMPYSEAGRARLQSLQAAVLADFDGPEARPATERCLAGGSGSTGAPLFMPRYNANYQIIQTRDHVAISMEQNREVRIIRLNGAKRLPSGMRRWMGDSIGWWEGDTLVVETMNFVPGDAFKPASPILVSHNAKVTERLTRISADEILYAYTVEDPETFTQTWRVEMILSATPNRVLEYACHEGNYSMYGMLAGGREVDRRRQAAE